MKFHTLPAILVLSLAAPALAQPGHWGEPPRWSSHAAPSAQSREGKVEVARFRAEGDVAEALAHGSVSVVTALGEAGTADERAQAVFEAAVVDQLARAGYDTLIPAPDSSQRAEVRVIRDVVVPEEAPHKPVSGEMTMGVSNRGSMMGMAINVDLSKPRKALVSTRLETRIRDKASGAVLWEGRAEMVTREGDGRWDDPRIAAKLAAALFDGFPTRTGESLARR